MLILAAPGRVVDLLSPLQHRKDSYLIQECWEGREEKKKAQPKPTTDVNVADHDFLSAVCRVCVCVCVRARARLPLGCDLPLRK